MELFLFLILINAAGYDHLEKHLGDHITKKLKKRTPIPNIHLKYVDDMALAQAMLLKKTLIPNPDPCPALPLNYHDRTLHILPDTETKMQDQLYKLLEYCQENQMLINGGKTKVMLCFRDFGCCGTSKQLEIIKSNCLRSTPNR